MREYLVYYLYIFTYKSICYHSENTTVDRIAEPYVLGAKGSSTCNEGYVITTTTECEAACGALGKKMGHPASAIDGNPCYITGNKHNWCKQDGKPNQKAQLVCKI